jgi:N6-adenosine-specific RNA methylase IME4
MTDFTHSHLIDLCKLLFLKNYCVMIKKSYINSIDELIYQLDQNNDILQLPVFDLNEKDIIGVLFLSYSKPKHIISYGDYKRITNTLVNLSKEVEFAKNTNLID